MSLLRFGLLLIIFVKLDPLGIASGQEPLSGETQVDEIAVLVEPIDLGTRRELFVDRFLVESLSNARLQLQRPQPAEVALKFDNPWEGPFSGYITIIKDSDVYRMYYRGLPLAGRDGTDTEVTCYAVSADGIQWNKPNLNIYEVNGSTENNIVLMGQAPVSHNFSPFLDSKPNVPPDQRYKALGGGQSGLIAFASPDGVHWHRLQNEPVFTKGVFDSQNVSFWSAFEQQYVCYFRTWTGSGYSGFRTVSRTTSADFIHWSDPQPMTFGDTPSEHLYTNQTTPYFRAPHIYLGLAARFMPGRTVISAAAAKEVGVNAGYSHDCSDTVLLSSRGGDRYDRTFMESLLRPGLGNQNWVSRSNYAALGIVPTGESEISIYVSRNYGQPTSYLQRYTLRTDGFASVCAGYSGGEMATRLLQFAQPTPEFPTRQLTLNMSTSAAGSLRVEIQNDQGEPFEGYSLEDCDEIIGDQITRVVSWRESSDVSTLAGQPIRIRFLLKDADLFSFQFK